MADGALSNSYRHIVLNSHLRSGGKKPSTVIWPAAEPKIRGPVASTVADSAQRDAIGGRRVGVRKGRNLGDYENG